MMAIALLQTLTGDCSIFPQRLVSITAYCDIAVHSDNLQERHFYVAKPLSQHIGLRP